MAMDIGRLSMGIFSGENNVDPFPIYEQLRPAGPVFKAGDFGLWLVTGYEETQTVLKNWEHFSSVGSLGRMAGPEIGFGQSMLFADPPDHTRLRGVVAKAFTPKSVAALEPRIAEITHGLLDAMRPGEPFDVVEGLAVPLPITVIAEMLGVDPKDRADFKRWSSNLVGFGGGMSGGSPRDTTSELSAYFLATIEQRRKEPRDDLISRLVGANENDELSPEEIMSACILLLIAGNETTTNLIGQFTLALARHPDEHTRLLENPSLVANAIEETLRWDGPVQGIPPRTATQDVQVGGVTVEKGNQIFTLLGAANRDGRQFPDPARFDVSRSNAATNVAFGGGIHYCLGAPLARLEARVSMAAFLQRAGAYTLANPEEAPQYQPNFFLRALTELQIVPAA